MGLAISDRMRGFVSHRMVASSIAPLIGLATAVPLPIAARIVLGAEKYAAWALFATINSAGTSVDFGGMAYVAASYGAGQARHSLRRSIVVTNAGSLLVGAMATLAVLTLFGQHTGVLSIRRLLPGIIVMTVATGMTSTIAVCSMSQLSIRNMKLRNQLLISQSVLQLVLTISLLVVFDSPYAIVLGVLMSSLMVCSWAFIVRRRMTPNYILGETTLPLKPYVGAGTVSLPLSALLTQGDRWFIGATSSAVILAAYDLSARFIAVTKYVCQSLNLGIVSDTSAVRSDKLALDALISHAKRVTVRVTIFAAPASLLASTALFLQTSRYTYAQAILISTAMVVGSSIHANTSPISSMVNGLGRPWLEARYLGICALIALVMWSYSLVYRDSSLALITSGFALSIGSIYFIITTRALYEVKLI